MKKFKKIISIFCACLLAVSSTIAVSAYENEYNSDINNVKNVTAVVRQNDEDCVYCALTSTAESYCIKNLNTTQSFSVEKLKSKIGESSNFGEVIYSAVSVSLGNDYYITSIEDLTDRGEHYIKRKIKENGAVCVAISLPEGGMKNESYYMDSEHGATFAFPKDAASKYINHAFSIVGWDDDFSNSDFKYNPGVKGAWLCKNSYGTDYGTNGYFWLSYCCDFLYASAVEVSQLSNVTGTVSADKSLYKFKYVNAIGFKSCVNQKNCSVKVQFNNTGEYSINTDIVDGYNFIPLTGPLCMGDVKLFVNDAEISQQLVTCYLTNSGNKTVSQSSPEQAENWDIKLDNLTVSGNVAYSSYNQKSIYHSIVLDSDTNIFHIVPEDGYYFTEDTWLNSEQEVYGGYTKKEQMPLGDLLKEDGTVEIKSLDIGSAYVYKINIITDEQSSIIAVKTVGENGSEKDTEYSLKTYSSDNPLTCSLQNPGTETSSLTDLDTYYAVINVSGKTIGNVEVMVNGKPAECSAEVLAEDGNISVGVTIDIPSVTATIFEFISGILMSFSRIISSITASLSRS